MGIRYEVAVNASKAPERYTPAAHSALLVNSFMGSEVNNYV